MKPYKLYDNGGKSFDKYTLIIEGSVYSLSEDALSPQGVNLFCCNEHELPGTDHLGVEIAIEDLLPETREAVMQRMTQENCYLKA